MSVTQFESEKNTTDMLKIGYLPLVDSIALLWAIWHVASCALSIADRCQCL